MCMRAEKEDWFIKLSQLSRAVYLTLINKEIFLLFYFFTTAESKLDGFLSVCATWLAAAQRVSVCLAVRPAGKICGRVGLAPLLMGER